MTFIALTITAGGAAVVVGSVAVGVFTLLVVNCFNHLVRCNTLVEEAFSGIDVQLKRRHELIPNLVECVKGYATFERSLLEDIVTARSTTGTVSDVADLNTEENRLTVGLTKLFAVAEAYPDLKTNTNFLQLSAQLIATEDAIQYSRRYFNGAVRDLNIAINSFPSNLVAHWFHFTTKDYFEVDTVGERLTPNVATQVPS